MKFYGLWLRHREQRNTLGKCYLGTRYSYVTTNIYFKPISCQVFHCLLLNCHCDHRYSAICWLAITILLRSAYCLTIIELILSQSGFYISETPKISKKWPILFVLYLIRIYDLCEDRWTFIFQCWDATTPVKHERDIQSVIIVLTMVKIRRGNGTRKTGVVNPIFGLTLLALSYFNTYISMNITVVSKCFNSYWRVWFQWNINTILGFSFYEIQQCSDSHANNGTHCKRLCHKSIITAII